MAAVVNNDKCVGCGSCVDVCPTSAIKLNNGKAEISADDCVSCGSCAGQCGSGAIDLD